MDPNCNENEMERWNEKISSYLYISGTWGIIRLGKGMMDLDGVGLNGHIMMNVWKGNFPPPSKDKVNWCLKEWGKPRVDPYFK